MIFYSIYSRSTKNAMITGIIVDIVAYFSITKKSIEYYYFYNVDKYNLISPIKKGIFNDQVIGNQCYKLYHDFCNAKLATLN